MDPFNDSPSEAEQHPQAGLAAEVAAPLPRLSIIHLMAWMAATAVAFLPYQLQVAGRERLSPGAAAMSPVMTGTAALYGVAAGSYLFVITALAYWRRSGYHTSLLPGHWLAIDGACEWLTTTAVWTFVILSPSRAAFTPLVMIPQVIKGLVFLVLFLWLAMRSREATSWRLVFLVFALAPVGVWALTIALGVIGGPGQVGSMMLARAVVYGGQGLFLATAMGGDVRTKRERHWSHWLGAGMRLTLFAAVAAYFMYYAMFPSALTGQ